MQTHIISAIALIFLVFGIFTKELIPLITKKKYDDWQILIIGILSTVTSILLSITTLIT